MYAHLIQLCSFCCQILLRAARHLRTYAAGLHRTSYTAAVRILVSWQELSPNGLVSDIWKLSVGNTMAATRLASCLLKGTDLYMVYDTRVRLVCNACYIFMRL